MWISLLPSCIIGIETERFHVALSQCWEIFWPSMPTIINKVKKKNAKLNWNHEANPSVLAARSDIYALEFCMSAQCVTGWSRRSSTRLNRFRNTLYTGQWDASALLRITNLQDMNRGSMNYYRACSLWITFVERLQFLKMSNHHSISD